MTQADPRLAGGWAPVYEPVTVAGALAPEVCERTISVANEVGFEESPVKDRKGVSVVHDQYHRQSQSTWLKRDNYEELFLLVTNLFQTTNNERYRFSIYSMESIQIIRYVPGSFYHEHFDLGLGDTANRKISLVAQLSDEKDYEGGELILSGLLTMPKPRGTACLFPSWFQHRVAEVKSGIRYSLTAWALGSYFF